LFDGEVEVDVAEFEFDDEEAVYGREIRMHDLSFSFSLSSSSKFAPKLGISKITSRALSSANLASTTLDPSGNRKTAVS
jgi:hypothetical protein